MVISMGLTSSQLQAPPAGEPTIGSQVGKRGKDPQAETSSKTKNDYMNDATDYAYESAQALVQLSTAGEGNGAPDDNLAASQQLRAEGSPVRSSKISNGRASVARSSQKVKNRKKHDKNHKKQRKVHSTWSNSGGYGEYDEGTTDMPSTPLAQFLRSSPPPYRPPVSQLSHALDDILTDDEDVTAYMQEYEEENRRSQRPEASDHDIYSFSQQPMDFANDQEYEPAINAAYHQSRRVSTSSRSLSKPKKRKRDSAHTQGLRGNIQPSLDSEKGLCQDIHIPIDPELHSMSARPPSIDLSQVEKGNVHVPQSKKRKAMQGASALPIKRRRTEKALSTPAIKAPYYSPYNVGHRENDMQDSIVPGVEAMQMQMSPELGTPLMADIAHRSLEILSDGPLQGQRSARRKKSTLPNTDGDTISAGAPEGKKNRSSQRALSDKGGPYTDAEGEKLDRFRHSYCEANNMSIEQFNNHIQSSMRGNPTATEILNECHEVLPYRPRQSVQKYCRRHFHNFQRGTWSAEEDKLLKHAVVEKGNNWKDISEMVGRMADDCRDRYRNYVHNSENRNREQWTNEEVQSFCNAIDYCTQAMKNERRQARMEKYGEDALDTESGSDPEDDDLKWINWQVVSDRMGGMRSRLQCITKWNVLQTNQRKELLEKYRDARPFEDRKSETKNPWRKKRALEKVANMKIGDQHALLRAIVDSGATTEGNIPWKSIGDDDFRSMWNSTDKKEAWWKMKKHVAGAESMDYREVANDLISRILTSAGDELDDRWDPEVHGDVNGKKRKKRKAKGKQREGEEEQVRRKRERATRKHKQSATRKSDLFVNDSDEEMPKSVHEPQNHNRYEALPRSETGGTVIDAHGDDMSVTEEDEEATGDGAPDEVGEADSVFDEQIHENEEHMVDGNVSPELASRVQLLKDA